MGVSLFNPEAKGSVPTDPLQPLATVVPIQRGFG